MAHPMTPDRKARLSDELMQPLVCKGHIRVMREDTKEVLWEQNNVIVNTVKWLFARLMANSIEPQFGVWGLALGAGDSGWAPETQPAETPEQTALFNEFLRKKCSKIQFVDSNLNPVTGLSLMVDFQTIVNATTDNIVGIPIREMGLIGGGTQTATVPNPTFVVTPVTDMANSNTPYFDPNPLSVNHNTNTVVLVNYKTLPPLPLPPGVNLIFSWVLSF